MKNRGDPFYFNNTNLNSIEEKFNDKNIWKIDKIHAWIFNTK